MIRSMLVGLAAVLMVAADAPKNDLGKLEGRWYGGIWTFNGYPALVVNTKDPAATFDVTRDTAALRIRPGTLKRWSYSVVLDGTPTAIDMTIAEGPEEGKTQRGIYKIEPNKYGGGYYLTLCVAKPGADRPERFVGKSDEGWESSTFARYPNARSSFDWAMP